MRCEHYSVALGDDLQSDVRIPCQEEAAFLVAYQAKGEAHASSELACFHHHDAATKRGLFMCQSPMLVVLPVVQR